MLRHSTAEGFGTETPQRLSMTSVTLALPVGRCRFYKLVALPQPEDPD